MVFEIFEAESQCFTISFSLTHLMKTMEWYQHRIARKKIPQELNMNEMFKVEHEKMFYWTNMKKVIFLS